MVRFFFCLLLLSVVAAEGSSQNGFKPPATGVGVIYNTETTINLKLVTHRSFGLAMEFGRLQTYDKTKFYTSALVNSSTRKNTAKAPTLR